MKHFHFSEIIIVLCVCLLFLCLPFSVGQEVSVTPADEIFAEPEPVEPLTIKLSVNEVQLDVVVLDRKGNPVTDLTAADFEVYQNGKRQNIVSSVYVGNQSDVAAKPSPSSRKKTGNLPPLPTSDLKREDTRRTIVFVVDDLSMSFENGYYARMALRNFVEKQMQPGDMVSILRTSYGNSALNMFLSDKRQLLSRIDAMRLERVLSLSPDGSHLYRIYDNQLSNLSYSLRALKDMPGRKTLIMLTAQTMLYKPLSLSNAGMKPGVLSMANQYAVSMLGRTLDYAGTIDFHALYSERFNRLAEDALRAGVVVNFLNIDGLQTYVPDVDASIDMGQLINRIENEVPKAWQSQVLNVLLELIYGTRNALYALNPLPVKTGGVIIENSNFFLNGIEKEAESLMKGYYLISYVPPPNTFNSGDKEVFNRIKVNVKRRNVDVYSRDGFFNRLESEKDAAASTAHPLQNAIFSPFNHADLTINISAGYVRDAKAGYLIRSWIHIDPRDVRIVENETGGAQIEFETVCLTSDINGYVHDFKHVTHTFRIEPENKSENIAWIQKHGIRFSLLLPVKKPGSYYVRTAVQDTDSGKVGSAYQFLEIPDLGKKGLNLSNIFMVTNVEDLKWLISDTSKGIEEGLFFPVLQAEEVRSPALRTYEPGNKLQTLTMLYNADEKAIAGSEIEMQSILYRDGEEFLRGEPRPIKPVRQDEATNPDNIPILQGLTIGSNFPPGDYVLQVTVTDKKNDRKQEGSAVQTLSFSVVENQKCETGGTVCGK